MKALIGIRKHLCVILVIHHKHKKGTEIQSHYTTNDNRYPSVNRTMEKRKSNREIASLLGKTPQTIHTEIKRGTVLQCLEKGRL